jgi:FAD/FMN-containing dehydrogenase
MSGMTIRTELPSRLRERVTLPGEPGWDATRRSWNLAVDQNPAAVVEPATPEDIEAVIGFAAQNGLRVAPQATGHGSESLPPLDGALLLKTSAMRRVEVEPDQGIARVEAGARAGEVADAAGEHRLAPVLGLASTVGVVGLALGGGTGWLSRAYGLTANNVRAFDVVTAKGERLRADARTESELFWALRGGGGRFAIVTGVEFAAHPVTEVSAGMLVWPVDHAAAVLDLFRRWTSDAPESLGAVFRYLDLPPIDAVPPPLRGRNVAVIAAHLGTERDGQRLMEPLRASKGSVLDTFRSVAAADLVRVAGDPEEPVPARGDGFLVRELTDELAGAIAELIAENALSPLSVLELRLLGGAMARASDGHGALATLDGALSVFASGPVFAPDAAAAIDDRIEHLRSRLAPWTAPQALLNSSGGGADPARAFDDATWERLRRVQDAFDPDRLILSNHPSV